MKKLTLIFLLLPLFLYAHDCQIIIEGGGAEVHRCWGLLKDAERYRKGEPGDIVEIVKWVRINAEQGVAEAQYDLSQLYFWSCGLDFDQDEYVKWLRLAAGQGHGAALYQLGIDHMGGACVQQNESEANRLFRLAAEQGFPRAQKRLTDTVLVDEESNKWLLLAVQQPGWWTYDRLRAYRKLGHRYLEGIGIGRNAFEGFVWLRLAELTLAECWEKQLDITVYLAQARAQLSSEELVEAEAEAQERHHELRSRESDCPESVAAAAQFDKLKSKAELGDGNAQMELGLMHARGRGVWEDGPLAVYWLQKAADQGQAGAMSELVEFYFEKRKYPKDKSRAIKWWQIAVDKGDTVAMNDLAWLYYSGYAGPKDIPEALKLWQRAADLGDAQAMRSLADFYEPGSKKQGNMLEAIKWWRKAATQGDGESAYELGKLYQEGKAVPKDISRAIGWYRMAVEQGYDGAVFELMDLYQFGPDDFRDLEEAYFWNGCGYIPKHSPYFCDIIAAKLSPETLSKARKRAAEIWSSAPEPPRFWLVD